MMSIRRATPRRMDPGVTWPSSGDAAGSNLGDPFGQRTFIPHLSGVDFHRGIDTLVSDPPTLTYAAITGKVIRKNYTMFDWEMPEQFDQSTTVNGAIATYALTGSPAVLRITGVNAGTVAFGNIGRFETNQLFNVGDGTEDWILQAKFDTLPAGISGRATLGIYQAVNDEYAAIQYDGTNFIVRGKKASGVMTVDGTTAAPAGRTWVRVRFTAATGNITFDMSSDASDDTLWVNIATQGTITWTNRFVPFKAFPGFSPAAAGANDTIDIANFEWCDVESIGRFGNWTMVANEDSKWLSMHASHIVVNVGDYVYAASPLQYTGMTGFDSRSGRIIERHLHTEYIPNNAYIYANNDPLNPMGPNLLPRCLTYGVTVTRTHENDPNGNLSHKLAIVVTRSPCQRFDINRFSLTGNLGTRTLDWNSRAGLNPADNDANNFNGVYFQPVTFGPASTQYEINLFFNDAAVGATFVLASVEMVGGEVAWSE